MNTILVVEDDADICDNLAEILSLSQYKVITAPNGKEGVEKAREFLPDLIISDINMPLVDGYGMLHILRKTPQTEHIPVVFLTSKTGHEDFRNAMQSGADDYITQKVSPRYTIDRQNGTDKNERRS